jgi:isoleucyl-tRNA synthetase
VPVAVHHDRLGRVDGGGCIGDGALWRRYPGRSGCRIQVVDQPDAAQPGGEEEAEGPIVRALGELGVLLGYDHIEHEYPHCWRSKGPVLYRATEQWFCTLDPLRQDLERAVEAVDWHPSWGRERMARMLAERGDWCISRQRVWGLPIPALWCEACGQPTVTAASVEHIAAIFEREGADSWWVGPADRFVPPGLTCDGCGGTAFRLDPDTLDVWFDSGSSQAAVLTSAFDLGWPADLYLEGTDQFRGWFNSSMITAVATRGGPPFRRNLCHGFVVDGDGRKMSKSLGNGVDAMQTVDRRGADLLRLWVVSTDFSADMRVSDAILDQVGDAYRKLRNTLRFLLGTLSDFTPGAEAGCALSALDRWALGRLAAVVSACLEDYRELRYHSVYQRLYAYAVGDLSAGYLDMVKDRLYAGAWDGAPRRASQGVLWQIAHAFIVLLEPLTPFTADEAWQHLPRPAGMPDRAILAEWPTPAGPDEAAVKAVESLTPLRERALAALEVARSEGRIHAALEAALVLAPDDAERAALALVGADAEALFGVSAIRLDGAPGEVRVVGAPGDRCARCWRVLPELVDGPRGPVCTRCLEALARFEARAQEAR